MADTSTTLPPGANSNTNIYNSTTGTFGYQVPGVQAPTGFQPIDISSLTQKTTPVTIPQSNTSTTADGVNGAIGSILDQISKASDQGVSNASTQAAQSKSLYQSIVDKITGVQSSQTDEEANAGIPEKTQALTDAQNALNASKMSREAELTALQGQGLTDVQKAQQTAEINRKYATGDITLGIAVSAAQGNLTTAKNLVDQKIKLELEPLQTQLDEAKQFYDENQKQLDSTQDSALQTKIKTLEDQYAQQKADKTDVAGYVKSLVDSGRATPALIQQLSGANNGLEAASILTNAGVNLAKTPAGVSGGASGGSLDLSSYSPQQQTAFNKLGLSAPQAQNALGIVSGQRPPLTGFGMNSKEGQAVTAGALALGYDMVKASNDWTAMQKRISTLNGQQQVRLQQAVDFSSNSLDVIDQLNKQWQGSNFPILNKANLALAKQGAYGPDAQSLATRFEAQINDLTSELGTVYKGGNSSTDESLKLAASNLSANWSQKTLNDAIALARQNLQIRKNSIAQSGIIPGNQYNDTGGTDLNAQFDNLFSKYGGK